MPPISIHRCDWKKNRELRDASARQLGLKRQKQQLRGSTRKPNSWKKNHPTHPCGFTNNLTPAPIQWHTGTREAIGRLRAKETFLVSLTSFDYIYTAIMWNLFIVKFTITNCALICKNPEQSRKVKYSV